mmetsp:Transcript_64724/g.153040  ORF Transcript_64724/g.153040 Transcript_64724/m.153040 type:complete len:130 (+) Transcript_64724:3-392(+)
MRKLGPLRALKTVLRGPAVTSNRANSSKSGIAAEDVERLAKLSKIDIEPDEVQDVVQDVARIIGFMKQIQDVDTDNLSPLVSPSLKTQVSLRDQDSQNALEADKLLEGAPARVGDFFAVPNMMANVEEK